MWRISLHTIVSHDVDSRHNRHRWPHLKLCARAGTSRRHRVAGEISGNAEVCLLQDSYTCVILLQVRCQVQRHSGVCCTRLFEWVQERPLQNLVSFVFKETTLIFNAIPCKSEELLLYNMYYLHQDLFVSRFAY